MKRLARSWAIGMAALLAAGCSSMTTPVLRHETGEALGQKKFRAMARFETGRLYPVAVESSGAVGVGQEAKVFQGSFFGIQGAYGLLPKMDLQLATLYTLNGGGWRVGTKYQVVKKGNFAVAVMAGYGRYSSQGEITLATPTEPFDLDQTLSGWTLDLGFPVSYAFGKEFVVYGGLTMYRGQVGGTANLEVVTLTNYDLGANLGTRIGIKGKFFTDIEFATLRLYDPIVDAIRYVPYWGVAGGINF